MSKVAIVTDSSAYFPEELVKGHLIHEVPLQLIWAGEELKDGIDIQPAAFYSRLSTAKEMPTTSQPSPADFVEAFKKHLKAGHEVLSVLISSKFSGTVASAKQALAELPGKKIEVVDSLSGSMGMGWPILMAARAAAQGVDLITCKAIAEEGLRHSGVLLTLDTLEFLHRGGRIGGAQRFLGAALNLKPILEIVEGAFEGIERVRTRRKALARLVDLVAQRVGDRRPIRLAVLHANAPDTARSVLERAASLLNPIETAIAEVSPAIGTHLGPDAIGLAYMAGVK